MDRQQHKILLRMMLALLGAALFPAMAAAAGAPLGATPPRLSGRVVCPAGQPVAGVAVRFHHEADSAEAVTCEAGLFALAESGRPRQRRLLAIEGDRGTGLVRLDGRTIQLTATYPVTTTVVFLHDADQHFSLVHLDDLRRTLAAYRARFTNVFHFNGGDIFIRHRRRWAEPTIAWYRQRTRLMVETMNQLGYQAMVPGNHELQVHRDETTGQNVTAASLARARFPLVSANFQPGPEWPPVRPWLALETDNGLRIRVLGLSVGAGTGDRLAAAAAYRHLAEESEIFVALTHIGVGSDLELAAALPELDIILGGHTHALWRRVKIENGRLAAWRGGDESTRDRTREQGPVTYDTAVLVVHPGGNRHLDHQGPDEQAPRYLAEVLVTLENENIIDRRARVIDIGDFPPVR